MSIDQIVNQGRIAFENIKNIDKAKLFDKGVALPEWNGLGLNDFERSFKDLEISLDAIYESGVMDGVPFNIINGMNSALNNVYQHCNQFANNKNNQTYTNAFAQVEALRTNISTWGLKYRALAERDMEEKTKLINTEISEILAKKSEIEKLKSNVEELVEPAVAGSLSKAFSDRKSELHKNSKIWLVVTIVSAAISIAMTVFIVWSIVGVFHTKLVEDAVDKLGSNGVKSLLWITVALRIGALVPFYTIFGLIFMQYKKERDLEEEYAHKSAVATSLPNYGGLAVDDKVKDQILSEASKVIFISPVAAQKEKDGGDDKSTLKQISNMIDSIGKIGQGSDKG